jgi:hypothetical protein
VSLSDTVASLISDQYWVKQSSNVTPPYSEKKIPIYYNPELGVDKYYKHVHRILVVILSANEKNALLAHNLKMKYEH